MGQGKACMRKAWNKRGLGQCIILTQTPTHPCTHSLSLSQTLRQSKVSCSLGPSGNTSSCTPGSCPALVGPETAPWLWHQRHAQKLGHSAASVQKACRRQEHESGAQCRSAHTTATAKEAA